MARPTGPPTPRLATTAQHPAAALCPGAARDRVAARWLAAARCPAVARRLVAQGSRRAPARTVPCAAASPGLRDPPRRTPRKPGPARLARTAWAAVASTGNPRLPSPLLEAPHGRARLRRPRLPVTTQPGRSAARSPARRTNPGDPARPRRPPLPPATRPSRPAGRSPARRTNPGDPARPRPVRTTDRSCRSGPSPARRTRRGCRARRPPCRTADRGCPAGPDPNTPPGPRTTARPPPGQAWPAALRGTHAPCHQDPPARARRRRTKPGRTTRATRRQVWPSRGSRRARAAPPRSRRIHLGMAGAAPTGASRHGRASLTRSTRLASSPHGIAPPRAPRGLASPVGPEVPPRPRRSLGTRPSR